MTRSTAPPVSPATVPTARVRPVRWWASRRRCRISPTARSRRRRPTSTGTPSSTRADAIRGLDRAHAGLRRRADAAQIDAGGRLRPRISARIGAWPRGDLNFPRAFFTEKAFPENEVVYTSTDHRRRRGGASATKWSTSGASAPGTRSKRSCRSTSSSRTAPGTAASATSRWRSGGRSSPAAGAGTIAAAGGEVAFPTGDADRGLGNGYHVFEPFAMFGQALPHNAFVQLHGGLEIPSDSSKAPNEAYLRTAVGIHSHGRPRLRPRVVAAARGAAGARRSAATPSGTSCRSCRSACRRSST